MTRHYHNEMTREEIKTLMQKIESEDNRGIDHIFHNVASSSEDRTLMVSYGFDWDDNRWSSWTCNFKT